MRGFTVDRGQLTEIARFFEVGTKAHTVVHKQGRGYVVAKVRGIKGNKALSKAFNGNMDNLERLLYVTVERILCEK